MSKNILMIALLFLYVHIHVYIVYSKYVVGVLLGLIMLVRFLHRKLCPYVGLLEGLQYWYI